MENFNFNRDFFEGCAALPRRDAERLAWALVSYGYTGEEPDLKPSLMAAFSFARGRIDAMRSGAGGGMPGRPRRAGRREGPEAEDRTCGDGDAAKAADGAVSPAAEETPSEGVSDEGGKTPAGGVSGRDAKTPPEGVSGEIAETPRREKEKEREREEPPKAPQGAPAGGTGEPPYERIVGMLNGRAGTDFRHTSTKARRAIAARWREGYRLPDFWAVVSSRCDEWLGDARMRQYLRPETVFGPKFEGYLQAARAAGGEGGGEGYGEYR